MQRKILSILLCVVLAVTNPVMVLAEGSYKISENDFSDTDLEYHASVKGAKATGDLARLNLDEAWKYSKGKGVNVAVIDGGTNLNDSAIKANIKGVYNAKTGSTKRKDISKDSHGTHCAKVLVSVAPDVNLYIIQAGSGGYIYGDQVLEGLKWAQSKKCRVINMSFGGDEYSQTEFNAINELYTADSNSALVCASAGNTGKKEYHYAASFSNTLSVGAATYNSGRKKYVVIPKGTYNDMMDVAAPGKTTSAASPFAAGVAALLFGAKPSLTARECHNIINKTAKDLGAKGYDSHYGYGLIQPVKALEKVVKPSLKLKKTKATIKVGKSVTIQVKSTVPKKDKIKSYKSSNKKVATVNSKGKVTGKKQGTAVITVKTKSGAKAKFTVRVKKK